MNESELYDLLGFIKISKYRMNTIKSIGDDIKIPSEIAKELNIETSQVSYALMDLKEKKLVKCLNEEAKKGRLYQCTDLGKELLKNL